MGGEVSAGLGCRFTNANLLARSQDGTTQNSIAAAVAGGPVALDTGFHMFRIDQHGWMQLWRAIRAFAE